jgi:hypothetical protein
MKWVVFVPHAIKIGSPAMLVLRAAGCYCVVCGLWDAVTQSVHAHGAVVSSQVPAHPDGGCPHVAPTKEVSQSQQRHLQRLYCAWALVHEVRFIVGSSSFGMHMFAGWGCLSFPRCGDQCAWLASTFQQVVLSYMFHHDTCLQECLG